MPRIRTLKPEHKHHRKVGPLSDFTYRLWIGLITEADDHGRGVADLDQLRVEVFGFSREPSRILAKLRESLGALARLGLIEHYEVAGVPYFAFPSWKDHQKVDHPRESVIPPPNEHSRNFASLRETSRGLAPDPIRSDPKGMEGKGREGNGSDPTPRSLTRPATDDFDRFWSLYPNRKAKGSAEKAWAALRPDADLVHDILDAVADQVTWPDWVRDGGQYIPHPATWLRARRWLDVRPTPPPASRLLSDAGQATLAALQGMADAR